MNTNSKIMRKQLGISLVEIMVALVISLFLLGGVIQVYIANKTSYRFVDASSRIQENARFALDTMVSDIRMAGFWGCAQFDSDNNGHLQNNLNTASGNYEAELHAFITNPAISLTANDGLNGSDSITLSGSKAEQNIVKATFMITDEDVIEVSESTAIEQNDIVILSNCYGADIFEVTSVGVSATAGQKTLSHSTGAQADTPGNMNQASCAAAGSNQCLSQLYGTSASVAVLQTISYTIKAGASGEPALWREENGEDSELIESVEQMQILFGVDTDGDGTPNQYVSDAAAIAADSEQISAVRVFLVVRSDEDGITDSTQVYTLNGVDTDAPDNRLRQVFSATITLRNRLR